MSYLALYRKYRPTTFDEMVGQQKIVNIVENAIKSDRIAHAYLFSGPRGTGKTTTAKIIAKMINCENLAENGPCNECNSCINISNNNDIVEIDAASNNGIDEIRELREKVNLVPTVCKYKVYIIDEVHMLTTQAFNALLKTLEEPPKHAIFILATTEPHKIPLTVSSRCQKLQFFKISDDEIVRKLTEIAKKEKITIEEEALYEIAGLSDGGLRDAINILDQLYSYKGANITIEDVNKLNNVVSYKMITEMLLHIKNKNKTEVIKFIDEIDRSGKNISKFIEEIILFLKDVLIFSNLGQQKKALADKLKHVKIVSEMYSCHEIYDLIIELNTVSVIIKGATYPKILLIVCLLKNIDMLQLEKVELEKEETGEQKQIIKEEKIEKKEEKNSDVDENIKDQKTKIISREIILSDNLKQIRINNAFATASKEELNKVKSDWGRIAEYLVEKKYSIVVGLLRDVIPVAAGKGYLIIMVKYLSIAERLNNNIKDVERLLKAIYKKEYKTIALSEKEWNEERKKYIDKINDGYKYEIVEETEHKENIKKITAVDELLDLVGQETVESK